MHEPLKRIVPGAENGVLFVHGIVSTPRFFDDFAALIPPDWSVHSLLLPGHGGTVKDFGRHGAKQWEAHVRAALDEMRGSCQRVYIVGHSLGTLLSIREAVRDDTRIAGMLLLCVPVRIWPKPSALIHNTLKGIGLAENTADLHTYYGTEQDWRVWRYIRWIPRYVELFALSRAARRELPRLCVPARVYMAEKDELVSLRGESDMAGNPVISLHRLPQSHHHEFPPQDKQILLQAMLDMCNISPEP